jgi:hypothetical protein
VDRLGGTFLSHAHHLIKKGPGLLSDNSKIKTQCQVFFFNRMINLISILFVQFLVSCFQSMDYSPCRLVVLGVFFLLFFRCLFPPFLLFLGMQSQEVSL